MYCPSSFRVWPLFTLMLAAFIIHYLAVLNSFSSAIFTSTISIVLRFLQLTLIPHCVPIALYPLGQHV